MTEGDPLLLDRRSAQMFRDEQGNKKHPDCCWKLCVCVCVCMEIRGSTALSKQNNSFLYLYSGACSPAAFQHWSLFL